jgi:hypothetical protein
MPRPSRFVLWFTATVSLLFGFPAAAEQRPNPGSVDGLVSLEDGDTIWVTNADGVERRATFRKLLRVRQDPTAPPGPSDTAVLVVALPSAEEELPLPQVRRVASAPA